MSDAIERFVRNGLRVSIFYDPDAESPRTTCDNLSTMVCKHRRYNLGDKDAEDPPEDALAVLPLYLYDHSGLSISTGGFSDRWDSGQVGWAYVTAESAKAMGCVGERWDLNEHGNRVLVGTWDRAALEESIRGEVREYDDFLGGRTYGYTVETRSGEHVSSCWGYVGDLKFVREEACADADSQNNPDAEELAGRATFAAGGVT
jgi:hypothetical protein